MSHNPSNSPPQARSSSGKFIPVWNDQRVEELRRRLIDEGQRPKEVAAAMGTSVWNIYQQAHRRDIRRSKPFWWTTTQIARLREMHAAGISGKQMAAELGRTPGAIYVAVHAYVKKRTS